MGLDSGLEIGYGIVLPATDTECLFKVLATIVPQVVELPHEDHVNLG